MPLCILECGDSSLVDQRAAAKITGSEMHRVYAMNVLATIFLGVAALMSKKLDERQLGGGGQKRQYRH